MRSTVSTFDATTGALLGVEDVEVPEIAVMDVAALADELSAQRDRLAAAEDALDHLIVASLDDLGGL